MPADRDSFVLPDAAKFVLDADQLKIIEWLGDPATDPEEIARRLMADAPSD
jgi:hypothetical protein